MTTTIKDIFIAYPEASELYEDANGIIWINKNAAEAQCPGQPVTVIEKESPEVPKTTQRKTKS